MAVAVDGNKAPELFALLLFSLVELLVSLLGVAIPLYAVIFGLGSTILSALMLLVQMWKPELLDKRLCTLPKVGISVNFGLVLAVFLFGWWAVGAGLCTFRGPYVSISNGYLACWASLAASLVLIGECAFHPSEHKQRAQAAGAAPKAPNTKLWEPQLALFICAVASILSAVQSFAGVPDFSAEWMNVTSSPASEDTLDTSWEPIVVVVLSSLVVASMLFLLLASQTVEHMLLLATFSPPSPRHLLLATFSTPAQWRLCADSSLA